MPQLVVTDFPPQLVWLLITFVILYLLMSRVALPGVAKVLDERARRVETDLEKAERLKADSEEVLATYQKAMADARAQAQGEIQKAIAAASAEAATRDSAFAAALAEKTRDAEQRIAAAKAAAMADVRTVAAEVAKAATAKLAAAGLPDGEVRSAVDAVMAERR